MTIILSEKKIGTFTWELPADLAEFFSSTEDANKIAKDLGATEAMNRPGEKEWTVEGSIADGLTILIAQYLLALVVVSSPRAKDQIRAVLDLGRDTEALLGRARKTTKVPL